MKLRQHRGLLADSMTTVIEIEPTIEALEQAIRDSLSVQFSPKDIHVTFYCNDARIQWNNCHIVTIDGYGVYGFTDGPIQ